MKNYPVVIFIIFCASLASAQGSSSPVAKNDSTRIAGRSYAAESLRYQIVESINNTWGYNIYINNRLAIHQVTIPGKPGNEGFKSKESAIKVAELVVVKMTKGQTPPSVTGNELKALQAF